MSWTDPQTAPMTPVTLLQHPASGGYRVGEKWDISGVQSEVMLPLVKLCTLHSALFYLLFRIINIIVVVAVAPSFLHGSQ